VATTFGEEKSKRDLLNPLGAAEDDHLGRRALVELKALILFLVEAFAVEAALDNDGSDQLAMEQVTGFG